MFAWLKRPKLRPLGAGWNLGVAVEFVWILVDLFVRWQVPRRWIFHATRFIRHFAALPGRILFRSSRSCSFCVHLGLSLQDLLPQLKLRYRASFLHDVKRTDEHPESDLITTISCVALWRPSSEPLTIQWRWPAFGSSPFHPYRLFQT